MQEQKLWDRRGRSKIGWCSEGRGFDRGFCRKKWVVVQEEKRRWEGLQSALEVVTELPEKAERKNLFK